MKKRIFSLLLALCLVAGLLPTTVLAEGSTPDPTPISVTVNNCTNGTAVVDAPDQWYEGANRFSVISKLPCVVIVEHSDETDDLLDCGEIDATTGHYRFFVNAADGDTISIAVKGDVNLDGIVTNIVHEGIFDSSGLYWESYILYTLNTDGTRTSVRESTNIWPDNYNDVAKLSTHISDSENNALSTLQQYAADIDDDGQVTQSDVDSLKNYISGSDTSVSWDIQYNCYTIAFDTGDGGSTVSEQKVLENEPATEPTAPTKADYTFEGWYNGEAPYDFNTPVIENITLTAKWSAKIPIGTTNYLDETGAEQTCTSAIEVTSSDTGWTTDWYVVQGTVVIGSRVTVSGDVHLILADGCKLIVNGGIQVEDPNALTIYAQSTEESTMGKLIANASDGNAGIGGGSGGGNGGTITINGGTVTATGGTYGAGIGGGMQGRGGNITITGGTVTATGGNAAYDIGSGGGRPDGNVGILIITVGSVNANITNTTAGIKPTNSNNLVVYGNLTLPVDLTIPEDKALTIPSGASLTIPEGKTLINKGTIINNGTLTNNGTLYVDGALSGTVSGAGSVYYHLALTNCTATGSSSLVTYDGKTYATAGTHVTLAATLSDNQLVTSWQVPGVTGIPTASSYVIPEMPAHRVTATANLADALTIDTQPTGGTITYGETATLSVAVSKHSSVTGDLTYQWYEGSTPISGADSASYTTPADLVVGSHTYHCVITCGTYTVTSGNATVKVNPFAEATPVISIDYENESLTGFVSDRNYAINGTTVTPIDGKLSVVDYIDSNISIVTKASDSNHADSTAQALTIPARPAVPTPVGVNETIDGKHDGQITGLTAGTVYQIKASGDWQDKTADEDGKITGLAPDTYQVRVKATSTSFASLVANVTIATGTAKTYTLNITSTHTFTDVAYGYTQPVAQDITITSSGNWQSTITGVTVSGTDFTIGGSGSTVAAGDSISTWTVQPTAGLAAGSYTATITVTYNDGATATAPVSFTVTKAAQDAPSAPTVKSKTYNSVTLNDIEDSTQSGAKAQYSMDGGTTWQDSPEFNDLTPSTAYSFVAQFRETDNYFASPVSTELSVTTNAAPSSGGSSTPTYPPTVTQPENGSVTVSPKSPKKGDNVTITPKPDAGYTVEQILVTDKNGNAVEVTNNGDGTYSFTQPAGKVDVEITFMEDNTMLNFFVDVPADAYYYDAVLWAAENGITGGTSDTTFSPDAPCTRAQIVTFLWRAAGSPVVNYAMNFSDVPADAYYAEAVRWAVSQGITTGTGNGMFSPDATCTRAQAMTFIYRSVQAQGGGMQGAWMFQNPFEDVSLESYYGEAVMWAVANGVTSGTSSTTFSPDADCTRAQIVTFLYRSMK